MIVKPKLKESLHLKKIEFKMQLRYILSTVKPLRIGLTLTIKR